MPLQGIGIELLEVMNIKNIIVIIFLAIAAGACAGASTPGSASGSPTQSLETQIALAVEATSAQIALDAKISIETSLALEETETPPASAIPASETPSPTASSTAKPTSTLASPSSTNTVTPTVLAFDPIQEFGSATILDIFASDANWVDASNKLPDTDFIKLELGTEQLIVTGKLASFDTWWLTWPEAADQYLELKVEVEKCAGLQAYGLLLRAPPSNTEAHGYILTFSCDGAYRLRRLDGTSPYRFVDLVAWTAHEAIRTGDDQINTLGIHLKGEQISIYANGQKIHEIEDDEFAAGRFGLFVNAGPPGDFTFILNELSFWNLD